MADEISAPLVSVVMSVFNGMPYLPSAVTGILVQSFSDFEFIIVDDGSTDATRKWLEQLSDPRVKIIGNEGNLGRTGSLNKAIKNACGKYIARQDADDISMPTRLERQVACMETSPQIGLVGTMIEWIDQDGEKLLRPPWPPCHDNTAIQMVLLEACCFIHGSVMFRREALDEVGGRYNESFREAEDYELWLRISEGWDVANLAEPLYYYRLHDAMASVVRKEEQYRLFVLARTQAIQRRLAGVGAAIGFTNGESDGLPTWVKKGDRRWLADRYCCWSASARGFNKKLALKFLLIALLADPTSLFVWNYILGIVKRKLIRDAL